MMWLHSVGVRAREVNMGRTDGSVYSLNKNPAHERVNKFMEHTELGEHSGATERTGMSSDSISSKSDHAFCGPYRYG